MTADIARRINATQFLHRLDQLGTHADIHNIIAYLTSDNSMTAQRLQILLYYAYGWGLVMLHREIAPLLFLQTPCGPLELKSLRIYPTLHARPYELDDDLQRLLDVVLEIYDNKTMRQLETRMMSHDIAPLGQVIPARDIYLYFDKAIHD